MSPTKSNGQESLRPMRQLHAIRVWSSPSPNSTTWKRWKSPNLSSAGPRIGYRRGCCKRLVEVDSSQFLPDEFALQYLRSAIVAGIVVEPERDAIIAVTSGHTLIGPGSIPWEIGNAFSAMIKQRRVRVADAQRGMEILESIPLQYVNVDMSNVLSIAAQVNAYAYDAYFLDCALRHGTPLLTLDRTLGRAAGLLGIRLVSLGV